MISEVAFEGAPALALRAAGAEVVLPLAYGPRVIAARLPGGPNLFAWHPEPEKTDADWKIYGGHRLWYGPEHAQRTYVPDNAPVAATVLPGEKAVRLDQAVEGLTGIRKQLLVESLGESSFKITHTLTNTGAWPVQLAPWALTVMAHGGYAILPLLPKGQHPRDLLPTATWIPWSYTDLSLPCWQIRRDCIGIDVSQSRAPQKLGLSNYPGWAAYWQQGGTFVKYSPICPGSTYPDFGSVFETFHNDWMIELETLSPLLDLAPGASIDHVEYWGLLGGLPRPSTDAAYSDAFRPAIEAWKKSLGL